MKFSVKLRKIIEHSGDSNKVFAVNCGMNKSQVYNYINDNQLPGMDFFIQMKKKYPWVNLDDLIDDQKDVCFDEDGENEEELGVDTKTSELLSKAKDVLLSGTDFSFSLSANIRSFYDAMITKKRFNDIEVRLANLEEKRKEAESQEEHYGESIENKVIQFSLFLNKRLRMSSARSSGSLGKS